MLSQLKAIREKAELAGQSTDNKTEGSVEVKEEKITEEGDDFFVEDS